MRRRAIRKTPDERRASCRFPIERPVRYRTAGGEHGYGAGRTVNISSHGVLFTTKHRLKPGRPMEISISWPVRLDGECKLQLVARGRVVRSEPAPANQQSSVAAVKISNYEFRTLGSDPRRSLRETLELEHHGQVHERLTA